VKRHDTGATTADQKGEKKVVLFSKNTFQKNDLRALLPFKYPKEEQHKPYANHRKQKN